MDPSTILTHYVSCALWSSVAYSDEGEGQPLDDTHNADDLAPATLESMRSDVVDFVESNKALLLESELSDAQIGHDLWLTRNRHGAGFWDRGLGAIGVRLSDAAKSCGSVDLYIGNDGLIYA